MKKLTVLLTIAVVCCASSWADNPQQNPQSTPQQVSDFVAAAQTFCDNNLKNVSGFNASQYATDVQNIANSAPANVSDKFDSAKYWTMVGSKWNDIAGTFTDSRYPKDNTFLRKDYADRVAGFTKGFLEDMVNGAQDEAVTNADSANALIRSYEGDYDTLKKQLEDNLKLLNANDSSSTGQRQYFDPTQYLDKSGEDTTIKDMVRAQLLGSGIDNRYYSSTIKAIIERAKSKYAGYAQVQKDLDWFLKVWGQASELNVMAAQSSDWQSVNAAGIPTYRTDNASYYINEYGTAVEKLSGSEAQQKYGDQTRVDTTYSLQDESFIGRSWGGYTYSGPPGFSATYNTIAITVGNRKYELYDYRYASPIVLDLDGDGKLEASNGEWLPHPYNNARMVEFDLNGDGFVEITEWVGTNDGLLVVYKGGEEVTGAQLFGDCDGFVNGYEKLSVLDANGDSQLSGDELKTLSVWQDKDFNAKVDEGEVTSLAQLNITSISLTHKDLVSSFTQNGETKKMWDWYPVVSRVKKVK